MKLAVSRAIVTYWNELRGMDPAPTRAALKPGSISSLLPDLFILQREKDGTPLFRLAGTRVCSLMGRELRQQSFSALFSEDHQHKLQMLVHGVADRLRPCVLALSPRPDDRNPVELEMVLLPIIEEDQDLRLILGVVSPVNCNALQIVAPLRDLSIREIVPLRPETEQADSFPVESDDIGLLTILKRIIGLEGSKRGNTIA